MRGRALPWLALLIGITAPGGSVIAATDPAAQLETCAARLDAARDVGVARILARCPELARAWQQDASAFGLPRDWRDAGSEVSAYSLRELARLLRATDAAPARAAAAAAPRAAALEAVLADWPLPDDAGLVTRLLRWVRARIGADAVVVEPASGPGAQRPAGIEAWLRRVLPWAALLSTLVLLAWVLWRERAAAQARRGVRDGAARESALAVPVGAAGGAPDSPGGWLAAIATRLAERGLLRHPAAATAREIVAATPADTGIAAPLALLATVADESRYAPQPPAPTRRDAALAAGRAVSEALR